MIGLFFAFCLMAPYREVQRCKTSNSAVGCITPKDMLAGRQQEMHSERDRKLAAARQQRRIRRQQVA
jgi:hypothetical protein